MSNTFPYQSSFQQREQADSCCYSQKTRLINRVFTDTLEKLLNIMHFFGDIVFIGKLGTKEIDFVAKKRDELIYVQACVTIPEDSTRETDNLQEIPDNYPKYVVTLDRLATGNENGIRIVHLEDFLLADNW